MSDRGCQCHEQGLFIKIGQFQILLVGNLGTNPSGSAVSDKQQGQGVCL